VIRQLKLDWRVRFMSKVVRFDAISVQMLAGEWPNLEKLNFLTVLIFFSIWSH